MLCLFSNLIQTKIRLWFRQKTIGSFLSVSHAIYIYCYTKWLLTPTRHALTAACGHGDLMWPHVTARDRVPREQEYTEEFRDIAKGKSKESLPTGPITLLNQRPVSEDVREHTHSSRTVQYWHKWPHKNTFLDFFLFFNTVKASSLLFS